MNTLETEPKTTLSRIPKGAWRNIYFCAAATRCGACGQIFIRGKVTGCLPFPSKELAEEAAIRKSRIRKGDKYLGAKFFPEK